MKVLVATHGHCFDGLCSAVVFTHLLRQAEGPRAAFQYRGCGYGVNQTVADEASLTGDLNAILDYRFTPSPRVDWYFDHHRTAFATPEDRAFFDERAAASERYHFAPDESSCTKLIYDVGRERFGLTTDLEELVSWADRVDSAGFACPETAIDRSDPVMQLVSVVEHHGKDAFLTQTIAELLTRPLIEVAKSPQIRDRYAPIGKRHAAFVSAVRSKAERRGRVVFVDLTERASDTLAKFVTYALFPDSVYSVLAVRLRNGFKISVGYNPWCGSELDTDISSICARYGGGGHPVVGGISVADGERDRAQAIANQIADELA